MKLKITPDGTIPRVDRKRDASAWLLSHGIEAATVTEVECGKCDTVTISRLLTPQEMDTITAAVVKLGGVAEWDSTDLLLVKSMLCQKVRAEYSKHVMKGIDITVGGRVYCACSGLRARLALVAAGRSLFGALPVVVATKDGQHLTSLNTFEAVDAAIEIIYEADTADRLAAEVAVAAIGLAQTIAEARASAAAYLET